MNRLGCIHVTAAMTVSVMIIGLTGCAADQNGPRGRYEVGGAASSSPIVAPTTTPTSSPSAATPKDAQAVARIAQALEAPDHGEGGQPEARVSSSLPSTSSSARSPSRQASSAEGSTTVPRTASSSGREAEQSVDIVRHAAPSVHGLDRSNWSPRYFAVPVGETTHFPTYLKFSEYDEPLPVLFGPSVSRTQRVEWALSDNESGILGGEGAVETLDELARAAGDLALFPIRLVVTPPWTKRTTP